MERVMENLMQMDRRLYRDHFCLMVTYPASGYVQNSRKLSDRDLCVRSGVSPEHCLQLWEPLLEGILSQPAGVLGLVLNQVFWFTQNETLTLPTVDVKRKQETKKSFGAQFKGV